MGHPSLYYGDVVRSSSTRIPPAFLVPMAAQDLPDGGDWLYELKLDGYRGLLIKDDDRIQIRSRNNKDLTRMYPTVAAAARRLKAEQAVIDGEIVALGLDGKPSCPSPAASRLESTSNRLLRFRRPACGWSRCHTRAADKPTCQVGAVWRAEPNIPRVSGAARFSCRRRKGRPRSRSRGRNRQTQGFRSTSRASAPATG